MNSIVSSNFIAQTPNKTLLYVALDRLGAWLDAERDTLGRLLAQASMRQAAGALERLEQLHLDPDSNEEDLKDLLDEAEICLELILQTLRLSPSRCSLETAWGLPGPDIFDAHVRWSGARLEDILATLNRILVS